MTSKLFLQRTTQKQSDVSHARLNLLGAELSAYRMILLLPTRKGSGIPNRMQMGNWYGWKQLGKEKQKNTTAQIRSAFLSATLTFGKECLNSIVTPHTDSKRAIQNTLKRCFTSMYKSGAVERIENQQSLYSQRAFNFKINTNKLQ